MVDLRKLALAGAAGIVGKISENTVAQSVLFNALRLNRVETRRLITDDNIRFICYCLSRRNRSRSQILQDLWVCFELGERTGGYFVEFGATNGIKNSNTWLLETELSWTGILAEPNPVWHAELAINRRAAIEHRCVSSKSGDVVSFLATNDTDPELSGMAVSAASDHFAATRSSGACIQLETISLDDLLDKYEAPPLIDYISIDTEGSELDILAAYSFKRKFRIMSVEHNPKNETAIDDLLASQGYQRVFKTFSQWDSWYVSRDLRAESPTDIIAPES